MKAAIDLLSAIAGGPATAEARACATRLRDAGAATPDIANAIARAPEPSATASITWILVTFSGIVIASLATARAISVMNSAPGMTPIIPWWTPTLVVIPGLLVIFGSAARARADADRAATQAAARLGLDLLGHGMPERLAVEVASHLYGLDEESRRAFGQSAWSAAASTTPRQRVALALALHATKEPAKRRRVASTLLAGLLVLALFVVFFLVYLDVIAVNVTPQDLWMTGPFPAEAHR